MDPDERQQQREARRRARQERMEPAEDAAVQDVSSAAASSWGAPADSDSQAASEEQERRERREREDREAKEREQEELDRQQRMRERRQREAEEEKEREEAERQRESERARKAAQEDSARQKKPAKKPEKKRKGLGGLSPEKKRMLKTLIMQKAAEEMKAEAKKRQEEKENYISGVVPKLEIDSTSTDEITRVVKMYYEKLCVLEGDKYDWEIKLRNLDFEINELTLKVNNAKGKFVKPVLKRVSKSEGIWSKLDKHRSQNQISFRDQLKSTGQNKFALDEKEETHKNPDWRDHLKPKESEEVTEEAHVEQ